MQTKNSFYPIDGSIKTPAAHLISIHYTLKLASGEEVDSNKGGEPMVFQSGSGQMLIALEEEVIKMKAGESKTIELPPEKAFGPILDDKKREFPISSIPEEARNIGHQIMSRSPAGEERMLEVVGIHGDTVIIDFNHDLAGQTLVFDIDVVSNTPIPLSS